MSEDEGEDDLLKAAALIRYYFKTDPYKKTDEEFYSLLGEALWLQEYLDKKQEYIMANAIAKAFGDD
ncbi:DUF6890 family protein [Tenacibaculum xiamenense]|uniref:DUF6890 family protein n=1 Tax=Tenacibaculum xiamenense TaxID=1261553 RepID=UPI0038B4B861